MPSERFLKLSEEKQKRIVEAAVNEFARVPFESVSINQIIREAGISRGSFYTYFEDKRDLLGYVFECNWKLMFDSLKDCLLQEKGDLWLAMDKWFSMILAHRHDEIVENNIKIMANTGINHESEIFRGNRFCEAEKQRKKQSEEQIRWIVDHVDPACLDVTKPFPELKTLFQLLIGITMMSLIGTMVRDEDEAKIQRKYRTILDYFRYGACPRERREE